MLVFEFRRVRIYSRTVISLLTVIRFWSTSVIGITFIIFFLLIVGKNKYLFIRKWGDIYVIWYL